MWRKKQEERWIVSSLGAICYGLQFTQTRKVLDFKMKKTFSQWVHKLKVIC